MRIRLTAAADAAGLSLLAVACVLPAILPFVRRAAPVVLVIAGLLGLHALVRAGALAKWFARVRRQPTSIMFWLFLSWAGCSAFWSPVPARAAVAVAGLGLMWASASLAMAHQADPGARRASGAFVLCVAAGAGVVALDLALGGYLLRLIHQIALPYRYNMVLVSLIAFLCVALDARFRLLPRLACALIMLAAVSLSESETAKVGCGLVLIVNLVARVAPRRVSVWLASILLSALWLGLPWIVEIASAAADLLPSIKIEGHAAERLQIWNGFLEMARAGLPWGWGVEAVSAASMTSFFAGATPAAREALTYMHPHNMAIQILVEAGWPGLLAAVTLSGLVLRAIARSAPEDFASGLTLFAFACFVGIVSHGLWQAWWWASVLCACLVLKSLPDAARAAAFGREASFAKS